MGGGLHGGGSNQVKGRGAFNRRSVLFGGERESVQKGGGGGYTEMGKTYDFKRTGEIWGRVDLQEMRTSGQKENRHTTQNKKRLIKNIRRSNLQNGRTARARKKRGKRETARLFGSS